MSGARAIAGDFADFKLVKTRSVAQLVIEVPIEQGEEVIRIFGLPQPGKTTRLAVARLIEAKQIESEVMPNSTGPAGLHTKQAGERRDWSSLSPAAQAGIRCGEPAFRKFLTEHGGATINTAETAATYVRMICGVHSRADIGKDRASLVKWRDLEAEYQLWRNDPDYDPSSSLHTQREDAA